MRFYWKNQEIDGFYETGNAPFLISKPNFHCEIQYFKS